MISTATSSDISQLDAPIAVLPVGSFEQHGSHLPLATDTLVASAIAKAIAEHYRLFLLPPITISCSHEHAAWLGTVSISSATLRAMILDIKNSLAQSGIRSLAIVNGHGGNYVLANVVQEANIGGPALTLFPGRTEWERARRSAELSTSAHEDMHGGELETSILLHSYPGTVRNGYSSTDVDGSDDRAHLLIYGMKEYTTTGIIGRPSEASVDKGKKVIDSLVGAFDTHYTALSK